MNQALIDLYIAMMRNPPTTNAPGKDLLARVVEQRMARFDKAKITRPFILPALQQVAQGNAGVNYAAILNNVLNDTVTAYTPSSSKSLLITGMISNLVGENVRLQDTLGERSWSDFPTPARAISGMSPEATGLNAYLDIGEPFELRPGNQLALDIVNATPRNGAKVYACFEGIKVSELRETGLDRYDENDAAAIQEIRDHIPPRNYDIFLPVPFDGTANQALRNLKTKSVTLPVLIYGMTTTLKNCLISVMDSNDTAWMPVEVPVWAVAGYNLNRARPFIRFKKPYLLNGGVELIVTAYNTADALQPNDAAGSITFKGVTP